MADFSFRATQGVVEQTIRLYRGHPDFDDIVQEAVIATWRAVERKPGYSVKTLAQRCARWQLQEWRRSPASGTLGSRHYGYVEVEQLHEKADEFMHSRHDLSPEQLEARLIWNEFFAGPVKPHYLQALVLIYRHGMPVYKAAEAVGISKNSLEKGLELAFRRYRERCDDTPKPKNRDKRQLQKAVKNWKQREYRRQKRCGA